MEQVNPYAPPGAADRSHFHGSGLFARMFIAVVTAWGLYNFLTQHMAGIHMWVLQQRGIPLRDMYIHMYTAPDFLVLLHTVHLCACATGGYWLARLSMTNKLSTAVVAGALYIGTEAVSYLHPYSLPMPAWSHVLSFLIPIPGFVLGSLIERRTRQQDRHA